MDVPDRSAGCPGWGHTLQLAGVRKVPLAEGRLMGASGIDTGHPHGDNEGVLSGDVHGRRSRGGT
jgi:hypothetical protein